MPAFFSGTFQFKYPGVGPGYRDYCKFQNGSTMQSPLRPTVLECCLQTAHAQTSKFTTYIDKPFFFFCYLAKLRVKWDKVCKSLSKVSGKNKILINANPYLPQIWSLFLHMSAHTQTHIQAHPASLPYNQTTS